VFLRFASSNALVADFSLVAVRDVDLHGAATGRRVRQVFCAKNFYEKFVLAILVCHISFKKNYGEIMTSRSVTIDEAVALLINLDHVPPGHSTIQITSYFLEHAEVAYENAKIGRLPESQIEKLRLNFEVCLARHQMAENLFQQILMEVKNPKESLLEISRDSSITQKLTLDSLIYWAAEKLYIEINLNSTTTTSNSIAVTKSEKTQQTKESTRKLNNLYVTFAFLVDIFAKTNQHKFFKGKEGKTLNYSAIAMSLDVHIKKTLGFEEHDTIEPKEQDIQSVRKTISSALKAKKIYIEDNKKDII
jgi:hypothetical protein